MKTWNSPPEYPTYFTNAYEEEQAALRLTLAIFRKLDSEARRKNALISLTEMRTLRNGRGILPR